VHRIGRVGLCARQSRAFRINLTAARAIAFDAPPQLMVPTDRVIE
jgi:hypothetical protein